MPNEVNEDVNIDVKNSNGIRPRAVKLSAEELRESIEIVERTVRELEDSQNSQRIRALDNLVIDL